jgi:Co/Zn/Cd efflux system component
MIKDFVTSGLLTASIYISMKANEAAQTKQDVQYTYGYARFNILAAFSNMVYIECTVLFNFLDLIHHVIEHEESEQHAIPEGALGAE